MHRFEVYAGNTLIGYTELEFGDPPMGVAFGQFIPSPAYTQVQERFVAAGSAGVADLEVTIRLRGGTELVCSGGVGILDHSAEVGTEGIEVNALGISEPPYDQLFPEHVAAYKAKFQ